MEAVLAQYGALGAMLTVAFTVIRALYKREIERADRAEADLRQLNALVRDQLVPVIIRATEAIAQVTELLAERRHERGYSYSYGPPQPPPNPGTGTAYGIARPPPGRHWALGSDYEQP